MSHTEFAIEAADQIDAVFGTRGWYDFERLKGKPEVRNVLDADRDRQVAFVREAVERRARVAERLRTAEGGEMQERETFNLHDSTGYPVGSVVVADQLLRRKLPFTDEDLAFVVERTACVPLVAVFSTPYLPKFVTKIEKHVAEHGLTDALREPLERLESALSKMPTADERKLGSRVAALFGTGSRTLPIQPGEAWSDIAIADIDAASTADRTAWIELFAHAQTASAGKPSAKWLKTSEPLVNGIGHESFVDHVARWFPLVDKPRTGEIPGWGRPDFSGYASVILDSHEDLLKGLAWCCSRCDDPAVSRALTALAVTSYKKVPGIGPRMVKVGNACVWALGAIPGLDAVGQLALLKVKVKFRTAQKGIEKALAGAAEREGVPRADLEEMAVPSYGLSAVGQLTEELGEFTAELTVTGTSTTALVWIKPDGKRQKSVPAVVKRDFAEELKELKAAAKDVQKMLPAQSERIDNLFFARKSWPFDVWRERYLDHPLVGTIARRLIWSIESEDGLGRSAVFDDGGLVDADDDPVTVDESATVALWHPIDRPVEDVLAWRDWFVRHEVRQPFKQAHREVYLLTEAERNTHVYSNRFAAHVVKQHQFNALCAARGWRNSLRLMVDDDFPPATKELPQWGLRAEFWIEGIGDEYGVDTNEMGTFLYLATDQVRFYAIDAPEHWAHATGGGYDTAWNAGAADEPLPLEHVPPLALSEVLRDVDLFVGVASVGNDPTWQDGGPEGRHIDYWQRISFGELGATAQTRKQVLERIVPRLRIANRCSFVDRFLVVRGDLRTYKIHLGSGNILMEPNDEYLCIVPKSGTGGGDGKVFLPFEGDRTTSIVLSKAFLLAGDKKITDPTITSQINH